MEIEGVGHAIITRRWTDELARSVSSGSVAVAPPPGNDVLPIERQKALRELYETPGENSASLEDFEVANIAREQLQDMIDKFNKETKPSTWQQLGFSHKSGKTRAAELLRNSVDVEIGDLKASIDDLENEQAKKHGEVHNAFKKICSTLDEHRSILKVFPSQNNYASPLVGSVTILMTAAKTHTEISIMLSKSVAEIFEKVSTCSSAITIIKTPRARRKLAEIYARMFQFYKRALEWYMQSRFGRFIRSFNENLVKEFEDAKNELEESVKELYREVLVANAAMLAMVNGRVENLEIEQWRQKKAYETRYMQEIQDMRFVGIVERAAIRGSLASERIPGRIEAAPDRSTSRGSQRASTSHLDAFIFDNEGQILFDQGPPWLPEKEVVFKLREWIANDTASQTLWVSSPYERGITVPGSRAAAMVTVAAVGQTDSHVISTFCKRVRQDQLRCGLSFEQVGLISLVYSFIRQLLQFDTSDGGLSESEESDLSALDGEAGTWDIALKVLRALLKNIPMVKFCVVDGLDEFEWGNGSAWCEQLLKVLIERQQAGGSFKILFSTAGQSIVLPKHAKIGKRLLATKRATEVRKAGVGTALQR